MLTEVFRDGELRIDQTLTEIRQRTEICKQTKQEVINNCYRVSRILEDLRK